MAMLNQYERMFDCSVVNDPASFVMGYDGVPVPFQTLMYGAIDSYDGHTQLLADLKIIRNQFPLQPKPPLYWRIPPRWDHERQVLRARLAIPGADLTTLRGFHVEGSSPLDNLPLTLNSVRRNGEPDHRIMVFFDRRLTENEFIAFQKYVDNWNHYERE